MVRRILSVALLACWGLGCASTSGGIAQDYGVASADKPSVILIYPFEIRPDVVQVDTALLEGNRPASINERSNLGRAVAAAVTRELVSEYGKAGINAKRADFSTSLPARALLLKGKFIAINQGDQAARVAVGFGVGVEKISVQLDVSQEKDGSVRPLTKEFHQAQGDKMPGMAVSMGVGAAAGGELASSAAFGALEKGVAESLGGLDAAVDDLVEHLVESTVRYYEKRGWSRGKRGQER